MDEQEEDDRRHPEKVDEPRGVEPAEEPCELLELPGLPDRKARQHHDDASEKDTEVEDLLYGIVDARLMRKTEAQGGQGVAQHGARRYREEDTAEMSR